MKTIVDRKGVLAGLDLTSEDHGLDPNSLRVAQNCSLQAGGAVKRRGFRRLYTDHALTRGMLCQRATVERPFHETNVSGVVVPHIVSHSYPSLAHGYLQWHSDFQPTRAAAWARDFRLYTGKLDTSRNFYIFDQGNDEDTGASVQWANVCRALSVHINTAGKVVLTMRASTNATTWTAVRTFTSAGTLSADTDYHIGISYDGVSTNGAGGLSLYINKVLDTAFNINWVVNELWHGETSRHTSYPNLIFLNQLYVQRELGSDTDDTGTGATPDDYYAEYPAALEHAAEGCGIYEIRFWSAAKDYSAAGYPATRPLTAAEYGGGTNCVGYWPCWDGGGLVAENLVSVNKPIQLLPAEPAYVPDTGLSTGYGLQLGPNTLLMRYWDADDVDTVGVGRALSDMFGSNGRAGTNPANTGCVEYTIEMRVRTPYSKKRRPLNAGSPAGAADDLNYLLSIYMAASATPSDMFGFQQFALYIPHNVAGKTNGSLYAQDNSNTTGAGVALSDDTVYSIWVTRSRTGALSIYLNNNTSTYSTGALTNINDVGTAVCVTIGAAFPAWPARGQKNFSGQFRMEHFRVWSRVLTAKERATYYNRTLPDTARSDSSLLINLEVIEPSGSQLPSFCSHPSYFDLAPLYGAQRLGPTATDLTRQWWDAWPNTVPPYWGAHQDTASTYVPVGYEGSVESIGSHRSIFGGLSQLVFGAHGVLYVDRDYLASGIPQSLAPARTSSYRSFYRQSAQDAARQVGVADRLVILQDNGAPHIWNGRALVPLGIDLPVVRRMPTAYSVHPQIAAAVTATGSLTNGQYYGYMLVYVDEEFNVYGSVGPFVAQATATGAMVIGSSLDSHADAANNSFRPVHCHLNPRVTSRILFRSRGSATAKLAARGPFMFLNVGPNADSAGIDGVADSDLGLDQLVDDFDQPPEYRYADIYDGSLVLAHTSLARDGVLSSERGQPETFNLDNLFLTEDGTGGVVTGVKTAFDSCWVFKTGSIWRFFRNGALLEGQVYTSSVGCIAPHSIVEFYNQAAGRRMIFFWGPDGPYLFDGNQPVYIGQPLKGLLSTTPFASVKPDAITDIRAVDVARVNEIRIWAKDPLTGELSVCFGYDYLTGRWVTHTGMRFTAVGRVDVPRDVSTAGTSDTIRLVTYMAGDARGNVLEIDSGTSDGLPDPTDPTPYDTVAAGSTTTVVNTTNVHPEWVSASRGLNGFVATLIRASGVIETRWILSNTNSTVTVERAFGSAPSQGDVLLVCGIQFHLEFPWDFADAPNDKFFHYLGLWHSGNLYYRFAVDWTALTGASTLSTDPSRRRIRHYINQLSEVLKVELTNYYANQPVTYLARALEIAPIGSNVRAEP